MPRRSIWSARLFDLPTDEAALLRHYTLSDDDIEQIRARRVGHNRLGFARQLCAFRYPGRLLAVGEGIPLNVLRFIARSRTRFASGARAKAATAPAKDSTTAWPGSTCSPPSSFTGIPPISAKRSDIGNTPA